MHDWYSQSCAISPHHNSHSGRKQTAPFCLSVCRTCASRPSRGIARWRARVGYLGPHDAQTQSERFALRGAWVRRRAAADEAMRCGPAEQLPAACREASALHRCTALVGPSRACMARSCRPSWLHSSTPSVRRCVPPLRGVRSELSSARDLRPHHPPLPRKRCGRTCCTAPAQRLPRTSSPCCSPRSPRAAQSCPRTQRPAGACEKSCARAESTRIARTPPRRRGRECSARSTATALAAAGRLPSHSLTVVS
eukprot:scaffold127138_cov31-Tisochrysis_lutea.AAC.1